MKPNAKLWKIESNTPFDGDDGRFALVHYHEPTKELRREYLGDNLVRKCKKWKGKWHCPMCKQRAPRYIEDVALLANCDIGERIHPNWDRKWKKMHEKSMENS